MITAITSGVALPAHLTKMATGLLKSGTSCSCSTNSSRTAPAGPAEQIIDTGMGIERVAALLQGTNDNYATDLMRSLIEASANATSTDPDGPGKTHHRVIADHLRSTSFLMADGVMPANDGRGYVLRRIMRRAMRHAHLLGAKDPLMHRLVPALVGQMGAGLSRIGPSAIHDRADAAARRNPFPSNAWIVV